MWFFHRALRRYMPNDDSDEIGFEDYKGKALAKKAGTGLAILNDSALRRVAYYKHKNDPYYLWNPGAEDAFKRSFPDLKVDPAIAGNPPLPEPADWLNLPPLYDFFNR